MMVRVWFGAVDGIEVSEILGTSYIDRYIRAILTEERKIVPIN